METISLNESGGQVRQENYALTGRGYAWSSTLRATQWLDARRNRLMLAAGLGGIIRGKVKRTTIPDRLLRKPGPVLPETPLRPPNTTVVADIHPRNHVVRAGEPGPSS